MTRPSRPLKQPRDCPAGWARGSEATVGFRCLTIQAALPWGVNWPRFASRGPTARSGGQQRYRRIMDGRLSVPGTAAFRPAGRAQSGMDLA